MNKAKEESRDMSRNVRREMARHVIDCSDVQITATHGTVYLHGRVRPLRGHEDKFSDGVASFLKTLRQRAGIRDVVAEWTIII